MSQYHKQNLKKQNKGFFCCLFEFNCVALVRLELTMYTKLTLNLWPSSCLCLPSSGRPYLTKRLFRYSALCFLTIFTMFTVNRPDVAHMSAVPAQEAEAGGSESQSHSLDVRGVQGRSGLRETFAEPGVLWGPPGCQ